jgi:polyhydroxyalkanoate synthase subunit PhaC
MTETAWQAAESAAAVLGPEADMLAGVDGAGLGQAALAALWRAARQPGPAAVATARFWTSVAMAGPVATGRWLGLDLKPPVHVPEADKRFADPTWSENPAFFALRQGYLAASQLTSDLLAAGAGDGVDDAKARLATGFLLDAARTRPAG